MALSIWNVTMKKILSFFLAGMSLTVAFGSFAADAQENPATRCEANAPYKYRIAFSYFGGQQRKHEVGAAVTFMCLERKIKTEADWNWLQGKIETAPEVTRVAIMSATRVEP